MEKAISRVEWEQRAERQAAVSFACHEMNVVGPGHWALQRPNDSAFWAHVVVMNTGVGVWGDIPACVFAYHTGVPEKLVSWVAGMSIGEYAVEKASTGMGSLEAATDWASSVAVFDLRQKLEEDREAHSVLNDLEYRRERHAYVEAIRNAIETVQGETTKSEWNSELIDDLYHFDSEAWEWVIGIGEVTSLRVIYALAAVKRLHALLRGCL